MGPQISIRPTAAELSNYSPERGLLGSQTIVGILVTEFQIDAEAITVASLGQLKAIKVNHRGGGPSLPGNEDIVSVYRELLKTHKPKSIGIFGTPSCPNRARL